MRGTAIVLITFLALMPFATASSPYTANGTFRLGMQAITDKASTDACLDAQWQGVSSSCVYMRSDAVNRDFELQATGTTTVLGLTACFFDAARVPIGTCQGIDPQAQAQSENWAGQVQSHQLGTYSVYLGHVPVGAAFMSVGAYSGTGVTWFFDSE